MGKGLEAQLKEPGWLAWRAEDGGHRHEHPCKDLGLAFRGGSHKSPRFEARGPLHWNSGCVTLGK